MSHNNSGPSFGPTRGPSAVRTAAAERVSTDQVLAVVSTSLKRAFRGNLKLVAKAGDVGPETAKNWLDARNAPALATAINLAREVPEFRAEVIRLMSPDAEFEPEFMQDFMRLAQTYARIASR